MPREAVPVVRHKPSWAAIGIYIIVLFGAITLARSFLMPLTLAVLLFFVSTPICRAMARVGVPQAVSAAFVTVALLFGILVCMLAIAIPLTMSWPKIAGVVRAILVSTPDPPVGSVTITDGGVCPIENALILAIAS